MSNVPGAPFTKFDTAVVTKAVVANCVVLFPADCVVPVAVIEPSFNNTPSIVTPEAFVFSLIVSVDNVPLIDI